MRIIITGASKGIGHGIAEVLAANGHSLGLVARSGKILTNIQRELGEAHNNSNIFVASCDLSDFEQTQAAITSLVEQLSGVDALINNVGIVIKKNALEISIDEWDQMIRTNISGAFYPTRCVLPIMKEQGAGDLIFLSSISGRFPLPGGSAYAATKYAVTGFADSLFGEVRDWGIRVSTLFPGSVDTESHRNENEDTSWKVSPQEIGQACLSILTQQTNTCMSRLEIRPLGRPNS